MMAVLAAGSAAYLALVVLTQALVADRHHGVVGAAWGCGVLTAVGVFMAVPGDIAAACWSFAAGCVAALLWAVVASMRLSRLRSNHATVA